MKEQSVENLMRFVAKGSSPNFASNVKQIEVNQLASILPETIRKSMFFLMISGGIESVKFAKY